MPPGETALRLKSYCLSQGAGAAGPCCCTQCFSTSTWKWTCIDCLFVCLFWDGLIAQAGLKVVCMCTNQTMFSALWHHFQCGSVSHLCKERGRKGQVEKRNSVAQLRYSDAKVGRERKHIGDCYMAYTHLNVLCTSEDGRTLVPEFFINQGHCGFPA